MRRGGFTLLETLLAITLTVSVGVAAMTMTGWQARLGTAAQHRERILAQVTETRRLLNDDLLLAVGAPGAGRFLVTEAGGLRLTTACRLPGDPAGLFLVEWFRDPESGQLIRRSASLAGATADQRVVGRAWHRVGFEQQGGRLWFLGQVDADGELWHLPLWTEAP